MTPLEREKFEGFVGNYMTKNKYNAQDMAGFLKGTIDAIEFCLDRLEADFPGVKAAFLADSAKCSKMFRLDLIDAQVSSMATANTQMAAEKASLEAELA